MQYSHSGRSHRIVNREVAEGLLESLRPTRRLLTRSLAEIPIGGTEYCQIDRVVREIDGLAEILISNTTHLGREEPSAPENGAEQPVARPADQSSWPLLDNDFL